ncbi:MAG: hypothetical protein MUE71_07620 [Chitinophagaceae bacterium]|jgi:hypothetical protein|nr:hypothetical protein [Chitinophagaceae bacterium]
MGEEEFIYTIIIEFRYGLEEDEPFFELNDRLMERWEKPDAVGKFDGNEISMDNFDARLFFYSPDPEKTLSMADEIFKDFSFLKGGKIFIRHGASPDAYTEIQIIAPNGTRTPLSKLDEHTISAIPKWGERDRPYLKGEEGEEWKYELKNKRAEKLYNKWREIDFLIEAIWDKWDLSTENTEEVEEDDEDDKEEKKETTEDNDEEDFDFSLPIGMIRWHRDEMRGNSMIIPAKISGAEAGDLYIIRMENAAIIRKAAKDIFLDTNMLRESKVADIQDVELLRSEIELFREYFREWVAGFEKDDFEDEWGLFV